jgi:hypothetical protein
MMDARMTIPPPAGPHSRSSTLFGAGQPNRRHDRPAGPFVALISAGVYIYWQTAYEQQTDRRHGRNDVLAAMCDGPQSRVMDGDHSPLAFATGWAFAFASSSSIVGVPVMFSA